MGVIIDPHGNNSVALQRYGGLHTLLELEPLASPLVRVVKAKNHEDAYDEDHNAVKVPYDILYPQPRQIWAPLGYPLQPQAYAMYAPELRGNSADDRIQIRDAAEAE